MPATLPASHRLASVSFRDQPRVLLTSRADREEANRIRRALAASLVRMELSREFGVFTLPISRDVTGVYLGRHDGGPVTPTAAVIRAARRFRQIGRAA